MKTQTASFKYHGFLRHNVNDLPKATETRLPEGKEYSEVPQYLTNITIPEYITV